MKSLILIGSGSAVGGILRYLISLMIYKNTTSLFPWGTLIVNWTGCFLMGFLSVLLVPHYTDKSNELRLLLLIGLLGGFTTFSTFTLEMVLFLEQGKYLLAMQYVALSLVGCLFTLSLGIFLTRIT